MNKFFVIGGALLVLVGCASTGNQNVKVATQESVKAQMKEGVTTKEEVRKQLGEPTSVSFTDSGNEIWTFKYSEATSHASNFVPLVSLFASGADVKNKEIVVLFDKDGKLFKYTMRETQEVVKSGILGKQ
jgi:outer membrane protein assembly factor BamE (lipoprotein component of BamABCDE complex)